MGAFGEHCPSPGFRAAKTVELRSRPGRVNSSRSSTTLLSSRWRLLLPYQRKPPAAAAHGRAVVSELYELVPGIAIEQCTESVVQRQYRDVLIQ